MTPLKNQLTWLVAALAGVSLSTTLEAQYAAHDSVPDYVLEGLTVTATRTSADRTRIPQKIEVISRTQLERSSATNVSEALRELAAIDIIEFPGLLSGVSVRGFRPQYSGTNPRTLVLVDGRPAGTNNLTLLPLSNVERIEILRGPASALYGSSAMGGVINVITRRSTAAIAGRLTGAYGSFDSYETGLSVGGTIGSGFDFNLSGTLLGQGSSYTTGSNRTFGGDSLRRTANGVVTHVPSIGRDSSISFTEYQSRSGAGRVGYSFADGWRVDVSGERYQSDDVENPGDINASYDSRTLKDVSRTSVDALVTGAFARALPTLRIFHTNEETDYFRSPEPPTYVSFSTPVRTEGLQLQTVFGAGPHDVIVGADYISAEARSLSFNEDGTPGTLYSPDSEIRSTALFGQARLGLLGERLIVSGGARLDRVAFETFETPKLTGFTPGTERNIVVSPNIGVRFNATPQIGVYGNYGRAFVTPEAFNVAGYSESRAGTRDAVRLTRGNADLDPERSTTFDAGGVWSSPATGLQVEVTYFDTNIEGRITSQLLPSTGVTLTVAGDTILSTTTYVNVDEARIRGLEGSFSFSPRASQGLRLHASATGILEGEERVGSAGTWQRIKNVADLTVVGGLTYQPAERLDVGISGRYVGERVDSDYVTFFGEILYPEYLVLDASLGMRLSSRYRLGMELRNLTDEDYFEVRGYNLPGRSVRLVGSVEL